ncbi:putative non-specific lipid-transfer protein 14 [Nymphaea thermarum]|nr:putative non-specific lipid-transfer protein 14 [Nymphaea thermarum]
MDRKGLAVISLLIMILGLNFAAADVDCGLVLFLVSNCSHFVMHGFPRPVPASPCCNALASLQNMASEVEERRGVCKCVAGLISMYRPNPRAVAALPSLCQVSLGFPLDPLTNCNILYVNAKDQSAYNILQMLGRDGDSGSKNVNVAEGQSEAHRSTPLTVAALVVDVRRWRISSRPCNGSGKSGRHLLSGLKILKRKATKCKHCLADVAPFSDV